MQLRLLERAGCLAGRVSAYRPFLVGDVRTSLRTASTDPLCPALVVDALQQRFAVGAPVDSASTARSDSASGISPGGSLTMRLTGISDHEFRPFWRDIRPAAEGDPPLRAIARGRVRWSAGPRFLAVTELYAESNRRNDPTVRAKSLRQSDAIVDVGDAYLDGRLGPVVVSFGRAYEAWLGEHRESLVLSAQAPMLDRLMLYGRWEKIEARAIAAILDPVTLTEALDSLAPGTGSARFNRALVGHVLTWKPLRPIEVSLGETLLFSRRGSTLDLAYLNPLVPIIVAQNDTGRTDSAARDNLLLFGGVRVSAGVATFEGELLVDDIQVDSRDRQSTSDQLGWRFGASVALPTIQPTVASIGYRRLGSFTYSRPFYTDVYQYYNAPLGSELGPDADRVEVELEHWPNGVIRVGAGVSYWRHGATRLERRPSEGPNFTAGLSFPSVRPDRPAVQRATVWNLSARLLTVRLPVEISVEAANVSNLNNQPSGSALYVRALLQGAYAIRYP